jgi:hypothetical protein
MTEALRDFAPLVLLVVAIVGAWYALDRRS